MSTQRRRVLDGSGKLVIPADGVYIEGLDGKAYTVDNWQGSNAANSIVVASGDVKFRIALTEPKGSIYMGGYHNSFENYMTALGYAEAKADYNGLGNTANILKVQPSTSYAAGYCDAYIFPDGKTKGYLPALGQWELAYQNKTAINDALSKCGGTAVRSYFHWSSTFYSNGYEKERSFWCLNWRNGQADTTFTLGTDAYVRPFADLS